MRKLKFKGQPTSREEHCRFEPWTFVPELAALSTTPRGHPLRNYLAPPLFIYNSKLCDERRLIYNNERTRTAELFSSYRTNSFARGSCANSHTAHIHNGLQDLTRQTVCGSVLSRHLFGIANSVWHIHTQPLGNLCIRCKFSADYAMH